MEKIMSAQRADASKNVVDESKSNAEEQPQSVSEVQGALTQAQVDVLYMQTTHGNAAVRRKLATSGPNRVQRDQPGAAPTSAPAAAPAADPFILNGVSISTKGDLIGFYDTHKELLVTAGKEVTKDGLSFPPTMLLGPIAAQRNRDALVGKESEPVDASDHAKADAWFTSFADALADAEKTKAAAASAKLQDAIGQLQAAANRISTQIVPQLKDFQRRAFAKEGSNEVLKVADAIASAYDTALIMKDGIAGLRTVNMELLANELKWLGKGSPPTLKWLPKVMDIAGKIDKAYAAFQLVRAGLSLAGGAATSAEEGRNAVSAMSTIISAGGTLLGASAGMTLYANLYIGPMVDACLTQLSKLEDLVKNQNLELMKQGMWDAVAWGVEPGGKATFDFMVQVMHAGSPGDIPSSIPAEVSKFLMVKEDALNAGVQKGNPMPTSGAWFWKKPDPDKVNDWLFQSRSSIWSMLYGSAPAP
jgi:hypothetical protein